MNEIVFLIISLGQFMVIVTEISCHKVIKIVTVFENKFSKDLYSGKR